MSSSWRGKRKEKDEEALHASDPEGKSDGHPPPPKKTAKKDSADDDDDIIVCEISKNRRVSVRNWNGKVIVDIREFYVKDGKQLPGKKGISLPMDQWNVLRSNVEEIDKVVKETS